MSNTTGVAPVIQCLYPELDVSQLEIIGSVDGHVLAIAGPGAGKTLCMALRAVNILLQGLARPEEVLLCTYNRDAATELQERFENAASSAGYQGDTGRVRVCTIHSLVDGCWRGTWSEWASGQTSACRTNSSGGTCCTGGSTKFSGPTNGS